MAVHRIVQIFDSIDPVFVRSFTGFRSEAEIINITTPKVEEVLEHYTKTPKSERKDKVATIMAIWQAETLTYDDKYWDIVKFRIWRKLEVRTKFFYGRFFYLLWKELIKTEGTYES